MMIAISPLLPVLLQGQPGNGLLSNRNWRKYKDFSSECWYTRSYMQNPTETKFISFMKMIWPTVYRGINGFFYLLLTSIKNAIKFAIQQIKGE
jgi:hypothetical protein